MLQYLQEKRVSRELERIYVETTHLLLKKAQEAFVRELTRLEYLSGGNCQLRILSKSPASTRATRRFRRTTVEESKSGSATEENEFS